MPQIDQAVGDDAGVEQRSAEPAVVNAREPVEQRAQQTQPQRQQPLEQQGRQKARQHGTHDRVRLKEFAGREQRLGAQPVRQIEQVKKK